MYNIETHRFDFENIKTDDQLKEVVNRAKIVFTPEGSKESYELDISDRWKLMSNIVRDQNNYITGAETLKMTWFGSRNNDTNQQDDRCYDCATGKGAKGCNPTLVWELKFLEMAEKFNEKSKFVKVHVQAESSVSIALGSVILGDVAKLNVSFLVIIIYSIVVLGKMSRCGTCAVLSRTAVAFAGVSSVGMSIAACYGINGYFGVPLTPVTNVLPFILIGTWTRGRGLGVLSAAPARWAACASATAAQAHRRPSHCFRISLLLYQTRVAIYQTGSNFLF